MTEAAEVEMVHLAEVARRVVALGYAQSMTGDRVGKLAATDPAWPVTSDQEQRAGSRRLVPWPPVRAYFANRDTRRGPKGWNRKPAARAQMEWVTLAEASRRAVTELGYPSMSRQRIWELANTDADWPVPRAEWRRVGHYWQVPWPPVRDYLVDRQVHRGAKGRPRSAHDPRSSKIERVTLAEGARRAVTELGYRSMTGQTLGRLAATDPAWPVDRAERRRVGRYWQVPWPPVRDYLANRDTRRGPKGWRRQAAARDEPEWVTLAEAARRAVVELGYRSMSVQMLGRLAATDPAWPVDRAEWRRVERYRQVPWPPVRAYLVNRGTQRD
jgi:hypothetical protein